ncbi:hypothetical protein Tco_1493329 [Tanacetum coccineum]
MHLPVLLTEARKSSIKKVQKGTLKGTRLSSQMLMKGIAKKKTSVFNNNTQLNKNFVQQLADDDDDFVLDAPKQQAAPKKHQPMTRKQDIHTGRKMESKDVREMGFASILKLDIVVNPLKLGYWVVDRLNMDSLCLEIDNETSLQITRQSVHDIFGFLMGNIKVEDITRPDIRNNITREWRGQYPPAPKGEIQRVYLGALVKQINKEQEGGRMFKMNLLVLMMTLLSKGITNGTANQNILPCLNNIEDVLNMDWCGYLLKCLRKSKLNWKRENERSWYIGPLLFLILFYLDSTRSLAPNVEKVKPAIKFWTNEILKKVEKEVLDVGGFGTKGFSRPVEQIQKLDNMATGDLFKYENAPIKLKEMFTEYLSGMKHPKASTMTHTEGAGQDAQLDDLWKKYVTRLLVWKNNILKEKVLIEADIYDKLTPEIKTDLNGYALERIKERLALWG